MKVLALVAMFAAVPGLTHCPDQKRAPVAVSEACEVIKRTLYPNCRFRFTSNEVSALSEENQKKITAVKLYFRQCPQAKACASK
jgi:hypothetical protein